MVEISVCTVRADFEAVNSLLAEMAAWDVAEVRALGISADDIPGLYYGEDTDALMARFTGRRGTFRLARAGSVVVGSIAVSRVNDDLAEIEKLFVRPQGRGSGLGRRLLAHTLADVENSGFATARLATASFMTRAIALYRAFGFVDCAPFHTCPDHLAPITLFMRRETPVRA